MRRIMKENLEKTGAMQVSQPRSLVPLRATLSAFPRPSALPSLILAALSRPAHFAAAVALPFVAKPQRKFWFAAWIINIRAQGNALDL